MTDTDILEPSIDPKTRKIGVRHVSATNAGGTRSKVQVRDFPAFYTDEPAPGIRPYFESAKLDIVVYSNEPTERFDKLCKNVEFRCPVMNLFTAAGVEMHVTWTMRPAEEYAGSV